MARSARRRLRAAPATLAALLALAACSQGTSPGESGGGETAAAGPLKMGYLLPNTGPSASLGPAMTAAVQLAVKDINAAGGVLGNQIQISGGDDAGDTNIASQALDRLLGEQVKVVLGPGSTSIALALIEKVARANVVMCSGATTGPQLTTANDGGYYFRTIYSNVLQGAAVAQLVVGDGKDRVAIVARNDAYGTPLLQEVTKDLTDQGATVVQSVTYPPDATTFDAEIRQVAAKRPNAIVLIGLDERAPLLKTMLQQRIGPDVVGVYTAGVLPTDAAKLVNPADPSAIEGIQGTNPPTLSDPSFLQRLGVSKGNTAYAPNQYDCAIIAALAAEAAKSSDPAKFKDFMARVTTGETECRSYADCKKLVADGKSIAYIGPAGALRLDDKGDPGIGKFDLYRVDATGTAKVVKTIQIGT